MIKLLTVTPTRDFPSGSVVFKVQKEIVVARAAQQIGKSGRSDIDSHDVRNGRILYLEDESEPV